MPYEFTIEQRERFADTFREARLRFGYTQIEVAGRTGVRSATLSAIERSAYPGMKFLDIARLCAFYNLDMYDIANTLGLKMRPPKRLR